MTKQNEQDARGVEGQPRRIAPTGSTAFSNEARDSDSDADELSPDEVLDCASVYHPGCPKCAVLADCYRCDGEGLVGIHNCPRCGGSGKER